jgi:REP element-mobilizing transposase RayT
MVSGEGRSTCARKTAAMRTDPWDIGEDLTISRRALPHWQAGGATYFIDFRLCPDASRTGALSPQERAIVKEAILFWHAKKWTVHLLTVMPDHVHILATPLQRNPRKWVPLPEIIHSIKRRSSREINKARGCEGALWQSERWDRVVRNEREYDGAALYILNNALNAGLVKDPWEYDGLWCEGQDGSRR